MKKLMFASHNSFTYLPVKWYMRPFNFMSKCQSVDVFKQFKDYNVRICDLRVYFNKDGIPHVKHGFMDYGEVGEEILNYLNDMATKEPVYIRVLLERSKLNCTDRQEQLFTIYCKHLENTYKHIYFTEGRRKYDWKQLYAFKYNTPNMEADFSSVKGGKLNDLWPWLYAKKHNKEAIKNCKADYLMLDFVEIK